MNDPDFNQEELAQLLDELCNGTLEGPRHQRLQEILSSSQSARLEYLDFVDLHIHIKRMHSQAGDLLPSVRIPENLSGPTAPKENLYRFLSAAALAASVMIAGGMFWMWANSKDGLADRSKTDPESQSPASSTPAIEPPKVLLTQTAAARFFQEAMPLRGQPVRIRHEYALSEGTIELKFPTGATAILEAPAIFEVTSGSRLLLTLGNCSVHAPDGAEGFRVDTPQAEVVDLGTRFVVSVGQVGETAIQMVDGEAEVYPKHETVASALKAEKPIHLGHDQSSYVGFHADQLAAEPKLADMTYRRTLPDRVISFEATSDANGAVDLLESVTVQRGEQEFKYDVDQLVGIELIHYRAAGDATMVSGVQTPDLSNAAGSDRRRVDLIDRDRSLSSGVINPGGSEMPLTKNPILNVQGPPHDQDTPGIGIRFRTPLVNSNGPDLVLFELQTIVNPESGDPFHVSPLDFQPGLRSFTISRYDIDLSSPEAKYLAPFRLYRSKSIPISLQQLMSIECYENRIHAVRSKALAVGIDLSDLGFAIGATTDGLFFQDAMDDENFFDPIFIAGLPPLP